MSGQPPTLKRGKRQKGTEGGEGSNGGGRVKVYLHGVTVEAAALLEDTGNMRLLQNVKKESRAAVEFDPNPSPVPGMKILIIRGLPKQIEKAVNLISEAIGTKETISAQAQTFWLQWVQDAFPDLDSRAYFLPPVYFNRVPMTRQSVAGQDVLVLQEAEGQAGQFNHLSPSAQSEKCFQPTLTENVDQDIQQTPSGQSNHCIYLTSPEESSQYIQATSPGQLSQSIHPTPLASQIQHIQQISPKQGWQNLQSKPPEQDGQSTTALRQDSQYILLRQPSQVGHDIQQTSDQQVDQYVWQAGQNIEPRDAGQYIQSITFGQTGQYIQPTSPGKAGQDTEIATPKQFGRCIQLTPPGPAGRNILYRHPEQVGMYIQSISPQHVDQYIQLPLGQAGQSNQLTSSAQSYQFLQQTSYRQLDQFIQPTSIEQPNQCIHPSRQWGQYIQPPPYEQAGQCVQLNPVEHAGPYLQLPPHRQPDQYLQPRLFQQTDPWTPFRWFDQSSQLKHPEKECQDIHQAYPQAGQITQSTPAEQAGWYIQPTATEKVGQCIQPPLHGLACELNRSTDSQESFQSNQSTQSQTSCQSNQSTPLTNADQCLQPAMVSSVAQSLNSQPTRVQDSDVRDDAAMQRVLVCLQSMAEQNGEIMFVLSQLQFGQYLGEPCYAAAAAKLPLPQNLANGSPKAKEGTFDALLIHRQYGFVVFDVKSIGDNFHQLSMPPVTINIKIRQKLRDAVSQLDKAEAMLSHLVSDIASGLRITKTIAFPNLTTRQVQQAICEDIPLTEDLCRCLGTSDPADIAGLCLCCDQLSDPKTPCDVSSHVLRELGHWWQRRVAGAGPDSHVTDVVYKMLVARFCGPATTVSVPCTCPPRVSVKTLGQAVWWTGECYTAVITLFPEQVHLLHTAPPTLFVTGPPGTGKTVVLLLMAIQWLRCGHHVYVVSTWRGSRAACSMLYHLLLQAVNTQQSAEVLTSQLQLLHVDLNGDKNVEKAVNDLSQAASGGPLYVLIDEMGHKDMYTPKMEDIKTFCEKLLAQVPRLHLWAASCYSKNCPPSWQVEYLTRPLRSPPAVVREIKKDSLIIKGVSIQKYSERGVPDHTDGPPVTRLYHGGQGHSGGWPYKCVTCGREVASFLHSLRVGVTENNELTTLNTVTSTTCGTTPPCLQWRDVLVLYWVSVSDQSGIVTGLREAGIPVRVMKDEDIEDVATARSDVVWVADGDDVCGLERKVVVCVDYPGSRSNVRHASGGFHAISRCTSQLVFVE